MGCSPHPYARRRDVISCEQQVAFDRDASAFWYYARRMSTPLAAVLVVAVQGATLVPLIISYLRPNAVLPAFVFYAALALGIGYYHFGLIGRSAPVPPPVARFAAQPSAIYERQCAEAVRVSEEGRIILDRSAPNSVTVSGKVWAQLPDVAQKVILRCLESMRSGGTGPIEVIER